MPIETTIANAKTEIAKGRSWRAKELLTSSIGNYGYSKDIFAALGSVLLQMGDDLEAGKYLLLTVDTPSSKELAAINLFLERYAKLKYPALLCKFPLSARLDNRDNYPTFFRDHLTRIGAPKNLQKNSLTKRETIIDRLCIAGALFIFLGIVICAFVGALTILKWLF